MMKPIWKVLTVLLAIALQFSLTGCKGESDEVATEDLFAGAFVMEEEVAGVPTYTIVKGVTIGSHLDTNRFPDIRLNLSSGKLSLSNGEYFNATYLGEAQPLTRAGVDELRLILETPESKEKDPHLSLYTDLYTAQFASQSLVEPLLLTFNRSTGEAINLNVEVPERVELTAPAAGEYIGAGEDFDISWTVNGSGYKVVVKMEILSGTFAELNHVMHVPVEQGSLRFSDFMQNFVDVYGPGSSLPFQGDVKVSVKSRGTNVFNESPYHWAAVEVQRLESSVIIEMEE